MGASSQSTGSRPKALVVRPRGLLRRAAGRPSQLPKLAARLKPRQAVQSRLGAGVPASWVSLGIWLMQTAMAVLAVALGLPL